MIMQRKTKMLDEKLRMCPTCWYNSVRSQAISYILGCYNRVRLGRIHAMVVETMGVLDAVKSSNILRLGRNTPCLDTDTFK